MPEIMISLFILNWMFSIIFIGLNHPLSFGCTLLIQSIIISFMSGYIFYNFWFSYILFLIMIGGMLIMFLYMTSIASNEKFKMPKILLIFGLIISFLLILININLDNFIANLSTLNISNFFINSLNLFYQCLMKFYNYPNMKLLITLMIYMLMTLIVIVKIIGKPQSTLRQKIK